MAEHGDDGDQNGQHGHGQRDRRKIGMLTSVFRVLVQFVQFFGHGVGLLSKLVGGAPGVPAPPNRQNARPPTVQNLTLAIALGKL